MKWCRTPFPLLAWIRFAPISETCRLCPKIFAMRFAVV